MANIGLCQGGLTLKALLENPDLQNPPNLTTSSDIKKEDDLDGIQLDPRAAFLGPSLWDRTDSGGDFEFEYMDLDEFLSENGIASGADGNIDDVNSSESSCSSESKAPQNSKETEPPHHNHPSQLPSYPAAPSHPDLPTPDAPSFEFTVSKQDMVLITVPGEEDFDPKVRAFSEEELKPQPMIKKSKKIFVPSDLKDDKYWHRRNKNNIAAKRSRDARRIKENQISMRAAFLEKENGILKREMEKLRKENESLKLSLSKHEKS